MPAKLGYQLDIDTTDCSLPTCAGNSGIGTDVFLNFLNGKERSIVRYLVNTAIRV